MHREKDDFPNLGFPFEEFLFYGCILIVSERKTELNPVMAWTRQRNLKGFEAERSVLLGLRYACFLRCRDALAVADEGIGADNKKKGQAQDSGDEESFRMFLFWFHGIQLRRSQIRQSEKNSIPSMAGFDRRRGFKKQKTLKRKKRLTGFSGYELKLRSRSV
jgi:hypothetical protein